MKDRRKILLVDDDMDFLEQIRIILESKSFDVVCAESQKGAEEIIKNFKPDLAILDLMMENYDSGFILSYKIKKNYPDVPVIMATAVASETGARFAAEGRCDKMWCKADLIMDKGIRPDQLLREVYKLLEG